jgi:hypothetical protein
VALAPCRRHGGRGGHTRGRHAAHGLPLAPPRLRASDAGAARAAGGGATPRASPTGVRPSRYPAPGGAGGRPTALGLPCARVERAVVESIPARCPAPPGRPAPGGTGHGAPGPRVAPTAGGAGTPCAPLAAGQRGLHRGRAGRRRPVILRLAETSLTAPPERVAPVGWGSRYAAP